MPVEIVSQNGLGDGTKSAEKHLPLGDETHPIILNSKAVCESVPPALQDLFSYVNEGTVPDGNAFLQELDDAVKSWSIGEE